MNEGGDEDGLVGTGKAGDAEAQILCGETRCEVLEAARHDARAVEEGVSQCVIGPWAFPFGLAPTETSRLDYIS